MSSPCKIQVTTGIKHVYWIKNDKECGTKNIRYDKGLMNCVLIVLVNMNLVILAF